MIQPRSKLPECLAPLSRKRRFVVARVADDSPVAVGSLGERIDPAENTVWISATSVLARAALRGDEYRATFVLNDSGVFALDVPRFTGPADRLLKIRQLIEQFNGAALYSINDGRGVRIVGSYRGRARHDAHNEALQISLRTSGAVPIPTAIDGNVGTASFDATEILNAVILTYFAKPDESIRETLQRAIDAAGDDEYTPDASDAVIEFSG